VLLKILRSADRLVQQQWTLGFPKTGNLSASHCTVKITARNARLNVLVYLLKFKAFK
jgi:hypothetical protein